MRQTDRDTLYEAAIFSKQTTDDERWEMDHREAPRESKCLFAVKVYRLRSKVRARIFIIFFRKERIKKI